MRVRKAIFRRYHTPSVALSGISARVALYWPEDPISINPVGQTIDLQIFQFALRHLEFE